MQFTAGFLSLGVTDIWGRLFFVYRGCPLHCRMFKSIPDLYPLGARSTSPTLPPVVMTKMFSDIAARSLADKITPG